MAHVTNKIMRILHECHSKDDFKDKTKNEAKKSRRKIENEKLKGIKSSVERLFTDARCNYVGSVEYASLNKMLAICNLEIGNEITAIHHLVEAHAVILRQHILHRYQKTQMRESVRNESQIYGLRPTHVKFETKFTDNSESLKVKLLDLPKEWYIIQVTAPYESPTISRYEKRTSNVMHAIHITILPTGTSDIDPLCITVPKPMTQVSYDVCKEIRQLLDGYTSALKTTYTNNKQYWTMRVNQNNKMKTAISALENVWLREWRVLFMADVIENLEMVDEIHQMIDKLISDFKSPNEISKRCRWLLRKVATGACFLTREEIARAIKFLLPKHEKLANNIILSIYGKLPYIKNLENTKRKTLVLIIDEHIDYIAFEAMEIVKDHPITRFPSLHVAYALFKEHEDTILDGCKLIKAKEDMGICVVNPSGDLDKMEKRMKLFMDFWLPKWKSCYNARPSEEMFEDALINHDILMYTGHGNGIEYLSGEDIERMRVKSTVLLFGCSSVKLFMIGGRYPPYGVSNQYLIACSPCLLGMLWEVTDADIDKMTANFISNWIPSSSEKSWTEVDKDKWISGTLKFTKNGAKDKPEMESEMLRAVAKAKNSCLHYMTAAAIVIRGLPVKIV
ncbi:PREDICTED: separin [Trachymyrmex cornetzi]|uniref:separase n=1 Tax=Trachymyrmex cornetzi TaxID=471704 RepID=A0A195D7Z4_9HYME|nr:PREDICTED: separin [Trachymyrmex cornetzi]KYN09010.1 Separin [Trachymyrmex cornetzi]